MQKITPSLREVELTSTPPNLNVVLVFWQARFPRGGDAAGGVDRNGDRSDVGDSHCIDKSYDQGGKFDDDDCDGDNDCGGHADVERRDDKSASRG